MPRFRELEKPLGVPSKLGRQSRPGLFVRDFGTKGQARVVLEVTKESTKACILWADGSHSVSSSSSVVLCDAE